MLTFIKVTNPKQVKTILNDWNPQTDTWLVSDLKSKQEVQSEAIRRTGYFTDDVIMRISDFWRLWLRRLDPKLKVVGSDFIRSLVQNFVDQHGKQLEIFESETAILVRAMQEFAPILLHPNSREVLDEWLESEFKKSGTVKKWQKWYQISRICSQFILDQHRAIDGKWSAAYLQSQHIERIKWPRRLFVDVGSELTSVEMGLLKSMAVDTEVFIITPEPQWKDKFKNLLGVYSDNFGYGRVLELEPNQFQAVIPDENFVRLSTQLAEIKFATAKVRSWLDSGVELNKIAIVAADIEKFWPVLQIYLDEEGIPYCKDTVAQINSLGDIQNFLAVIKNYSSDVSWDSLERFYYGRENKNKQQFEKFKALFFQLYDPDDLSRDEKVKDLYFRKIDYSGEVNRDEFTAFMLKIWLTIPASNSKADLFEVIFKDFLGQSLSVKLKMSGWISFLKNRLSGKEIKLKSKALSGIHVDSLMSLQLSQATHKVYIGLNEELYAKKNKTLMNQADSASLRLNFDLSVDCSEESYLDFNLRWQALAGDANAYYTSAHSGFDSDPLNASLFFIERRPKSEIEFPEMTRLDELQKEFEVFENIQELNGASKQRIQDDLYGLSLNVKSESFKSLAVSDFEDYAKCSFKLMAGKSFKLRDYSQVGIDLDPRHKGTLAHAIFEFLIQERRLQNITDQEIEKFLDSMREKHNLYPGKDAFWVIQRNRFLATAKKFIEFEKSRIHLYDSFVEQKYEIYFDLERKIFTQQQPKSGVQFNMRIDRYDIHRSKKYAVIYDYKSSDFSIKSQSKWLTEFQFQMLLYMKALKLNLPSDIETTGALYFLYKTMNISKGIIVDEIGIADFELKKANASVVERERMAQIDEEFLNTAFEILTKLNSGTVNTQPWNTKECSDCDWRKMCRATHLM